MSEGQYHSLRQQRISLYTKKKRENVSAHVRKKRQLKKEPPMVELHFYYRSFLLTEYKKDTLRYTECLFAVIFVFPCYKMHVLGQKISSFSFRTGLSYNNFND